MQQMRVSNPTKNVPAMQLRSGNESEKTKGKMPRRKMVENFAGQNKLYGRSLTYLITRALVSLEIRTDKNEHTITELIDEIKLQEPTPFKHMDSQELHRLRKRVYRVCRQLCENGSILLIQNFTSFKTVYYTIKATNGYEHI